MPAVEPRPFGKTEFVRNPYVSVAVGESRVVWAEAGNPTVLDQASSTLLDLFDEPLTPNELADDLVAAVGLEQAAARQAANGTVYALRMSGLLRASDQDLVEVWRFYYPPSPST